MNYTRRNLSLLAALLVAVNAAACGGSESADTTAAVESTEPPVTEVPWAPELPDADMTGETYTILTCGWFSYAPLAIYDIAPEEMNGEALNDAAFQRHAAVKEKYGCEIRWAEYDDHAEGNDALVRSVTAGDNDFDIALMRGVHYYNLMRMGALAELDSVPHLALDAPYYDQASLEITTMKGNCFGVVSDLSTIRYQTAACVFANLQLIEDYNLGDIYDIVRNGSWTIDKLFEMGIVHSADVDNNDTYNNQDRYAVTYINSSCTALMTASDVLMAQMTKDGMDLTFDSEKNVDTMMKVLEPFKDTTLSYYYHHRSTDTADEHNMFMNRHSMFHIGGIYHGSLFRNMQDDFAIIPLPKLEEGTAEYPSAIINNTYSITTVPITNNRLDHTGILMEELCFRGRRDLYPEMYETVLKSKIARDEKSSGMIDLIYESTVYDPGFIYVSSLADVVCAQFRSGEGTFASAFASLRPGAEAKVNELLDALE